MTAKIKKEHFCAQKGLDNIEVASPLCWQEKLPPTNLISGHTPGIVRYDNEGAAIKRFNMILITEAYNEYKIIIIIW